MSLLEDIRTYLLTQSAVTDIVGERISREYAAEQDPLPFVVYGRRGLEEAVVTLDCTGPYRSQIDVEARAGTLTEADDLRTALYAALHNFQGNWDTSQIIDSVAADVSDDYEFLTDTGDFEHIRAFTLEVISPDQ